MWCSSRVVHSFCQDCILRELKLFGLFNVNTNCSGSHWDNHVFDLVFWPCLEITYYQRFQGFYVPLGIHWHGTTIIVIINGVSCEHVIHSTTGGDPSLEKIFTEIVPPSPKGNMVCPLSAHGIVSNAEIWWAHNLFLQVEKEHNAPSLHSQKVADRIETTNCYSW